MSPIDMGRPMKIPTDGGLSMEPPPGAAPPPPPGPPPGEPPPPGGAGELLQIMHAPTGEFMVKDEGAGGDPQSFKSLDELVGFLQDRFGAGPGAGMPPPGGPPPPVGP